MKFNKVLKKLSYTMFLLTVFMLCGFTFEMKNASISMPNNTTPEYDTIPASKVVNNTKEIQKIYDDINSTNYSKKTHFEIVDGNNYFSWGRIDVVDDSGYAYQAIVFICDGSDNYIKNFYQELEQLSNAYSNKQNKIAGYLDLIRDNRLRNFGVDNFAAIEKVIVTNTDGIQYEACVVAICGTEDFMKPYKSFYETVIDGYQKNN